MSDPRRKYNKSTGEEFEQHNKSTGGLENRVRCPWCKFQNDHSSLADVGGRDNGTQVECDNEDCGNTYVVVAVHRQPTIQVKQWRDGEDPLPLEKK
jgi:hypothetical protein